jgi:hypothetical protein
MKLPRKRVLEISFAVKERPHPRQRGHHLVDPLEVHV